MGSKNQPTQPSLNIRACMQPIDKSAKSTEMNDGRKTQQKDAHLDLKIQVATPFSDREWCANKQHALTLCWTQTCILAQGIKDATASPQIADAFPAWPWSDLLTAPCGQRCSPRRLSTPVASCVT
eukprot:1145631-Pelagomonas_calceolata.AAC.15